MPSRIAGLVVDGEDDEAGERRAPASRGCLIAATVAAAAGAAIGTSTRNTEPRPGSERSADADGRARARCARRSTGRGRGRAPPWRPGRGAGTRWKTSFCFEAGMPRPVSQTSQRDAGSPRRRAPTSTRPDRRVLDRVRDQVLQEPAQQPAVRAHGERRRDEARGRALARRATGSNSRCSCRNSSSMRKLDHCGFMAPVSRREMSSSAVRISSTASSEASTFSARRRSPRVAVALDERGGVEAGRVERLQDVVAGGGEEARLRDVGLVGLGLGGGERRVEARQLLGALADALLEQLVGALARLLGRHRLGHVRVGGDEAAVGQLVGADLDHAAGRLQADALRLGCRGRSCGGAAAITSSTGPRP